MTILKKKEEEISKIRKIHFGLRMKFLLTLSFVMLVVISALSTLMYLNQRSLLEEEKNTKANVLTHILSGPAEYYLDKTVETTNKELRIKYEFIKREALNFKNFNDDIEKIILTDELGRVKFSTDKNDYKRKKVYPYIKNCLKQDNEELVVYNFNQIVQPGKLKLGEQKNVEQNFLDAYIEKAVTFFSPRKEKNYKSKLRTITYPIFLHKGNIIELIKDYKKYYKQYYKSGIKNRNNIYNKLWRKYKKILGRTYDPREKKKRGMTSRKILKAGDIDFMFLELFGNIMIHRDKRVAKSKRWMFRDKWLMSKKKKKRAAYFKDLSSKAKEINDTIISRMDTIASNIEGVQRLGAVAIIFNLEKIESELDQTIYRVLLLALLIGVACLVIFCFILNFMIQNLKKLESWAISVSKGNLDTKIVINTNDEIGRLGDIFNNMIDDIAVKYNLEKFVSGSAISMIGKKSDSAAELQLGGTERRNMVFLFSDVRGFTSFSEKNDPSIVMEVLNFYLDLQANVIIKQKGDIDDYIGDEIMAHFRGDDIIERAIESAIGIIKAIKKANEKRKKENLPIFEVGIGVHGGDVIVGNIGTRARMDFTCIGDVVNLSARLCSTASAGEILISKEIYDKSIKKYGAIKAAPISVKGKENKILIVKIKV